MVATLPTSLNNGHEPSGIEISELLIAMANLANYKLFISFGGCTLSTTSATYVNIQGATWAFTKLGDAKESDVLIVTGVSSRVAAVPNLTNFTVAEVAGQTHDTSFMYFNTANHRDMSWGLTRISNLSPSTYNFQLQASVTGGTTATVDANDTVIAFTLEIPL